MTGGEKTEWTLSRRFLLGASVTSVAGLIASQRAYPASIVKDDPNLPPYGSGTLPPDIRARTVRDVNGLNVNVLESGFQDSGRSLVLLLHGFPELAYGWRKVMLPLAAAGYHVVAPDQRGYGRTTGWDDAYDTDLSKFSLLNLTRDALALVSALGYSSVSAVVGHDAGSPVAAWCSLIRPDIFRSVVLMAVPFTGPPMFPIDHDDKRHNDAGTAVSDEQIASELAALARPRKYYQQYNRTRDANTNMMNAPQGLHDFIRAYFYFKSADWKGNQPFPLKAATGPELAKIPTYYIMDLDKGMAETVAPEMPPAVEASRIKWMTEPELDVYVSEFGRTGFQGALDGYRVYADPTLNAELRLFSGRTIDVPSLFIGGKQDWAVFLTPGAVETMRGHACTRMEDVHLVDGAGHWVQQEQPEAVSNRLVQFLQKQGRGG